MVDGPVESEFDVPVARPQPSLANPTVIGLFTLLLAFFIVLVNISTMAEQRARAVLFGVSSAFSSTDYGPGRFPAASMAGDLPGSIPEIGRLVAAAIPVARAEASANGRRLRVEVPLSALFSGDTDADDTGKGAAPALTASAGALAVEMARTLTARPPGQRFDVEVLASRAEDKRLAEATAQAATMAEALVARGAPRDSVAIGLGQGAPGMLVLVFYVRSHDEGRVDFRDLGVADLDANRGTRR